MWNPDMVSLPYQVYNEHPLHEYLRVLFTTYGEKGNNEEGLTK